MSLCDIHHSCAKHSYIYLNVLWLSFFLYGFKTFTVFDYQRTRLTVIFWDFLEITEGSEGDVGKQRSRKWRQLARKIGQNQLPLFVLNIHTLKATHELLKKKKKRKRKSWRSTLHWIWSTVQAFHELLFTYKQWVRETSGMTAAERFSSATFVFTPGMETWWYEGFVSCGGHFYPKHLTYPKYMFSMVTQQEGNWRWQRRRHRDEQFMTSVYLSDFIRLGETLCWIWLNKITNITGVGPL